MPFPHSLWPMILLDISSICSTSASAVPLAWSGAHRAPARSPPVGPQPGFPTGSHRGLPMSDHPRLPTREPPPPPPQRIQWSHWFTIRSGHSPPCTDNSVNSESISYGIILQYVLAAFNRPDLYAQEVRSPLSVWKTSSRRHVQSSVGSRSLDYVMQEELCGALRKPGVYVPPVEVPPDMRAALFQAPRIDEELYLGHPQLLSLPVAWLWILQHAVAGRLSSLNSWVPLMVCTNLFCRPFSFSAHIDSGPRTQDQLAQVRCLTNPKGSFTKPGPSGPPWAGGQPQRRTVPPPAPTSVRGAVAEGPRSRCTRSLRGSNQRKPTGNPMESGPQPKR